MHVDSKKHVAMTLNKRLSLLLETFKKLTPEEIDRELDDANAPLKERTLIDETKRIFILLSC